MQITELEFPAAATGRLVIDLGALAANWRQLQAYVGPNCLAGAAVKADAYGLGVLPVVETLARAGCRWFFVATPLEGLDLAAAIGARFPGVHIAVLAGPGSGTEKVLAANPILVPVLNDLDQIDDWRREAPGRPAILQLDSGMSRLGLSPAEVARLAVEPERLAGVPLAAIISHLACSDVPSHPLNASQHERFLAMTARLPPAPRSLAASSGIFLGPAFHFDMVRPGAALYGLNPTPARPNPMRQVVAAQAKILAVRGIEPGTAVGYGADFLTDRPRRIATIGVGYADGILRSAGNSARVHLGGIEVPVIGRVSMDLITLDVSAVPEAATRPGSRVDLIGPAYSIDDLARDSGTIGYELLTRLSHRFHRVYRPDHSGA